MAMPSVCRRSPETISSTLLPTSSVTRNAAPTTGTISKALNADSATNWISTTCQFAAVTSAPRFRAFLIGSVSGIERARRARLTGLSSTIASRPRGSWQVSGMPDSAGDPVFSTCGLWSLWPAARAAGEPRLRWSAVGSRGQPSGPDAGPACGRGRLARRAVVHRVVRHDHAAACRGRSAGRLRRPVERPRNRHRPGRGHA